MKLKEVKQILDGLTDVQLEQDVRFCEGRFHFGVKEMGIFTVNKGEMQIGNGEIYFLISTQK